MASSLKQIRAALVAQVKERTGIDTRAYFPDQITPPMMAVMPGVPLTRFGVTLGEQEIAMGPVFGLNDSVNAFMATEHNLQIMILLSRASIEEAQQQMDDLVDIVPQDNGMASLPLAIMVDDTLGGIVEWCKITQITQVGQTMVSGQAYFTARVFLEISTS